MKSAATVLVGILTATLAGAPLLPAQSVKQQELIAASKTEVAEHLADANKVCGSNVKLTVDYNSFSDISTSPDNKNGQAPWAYIVNATDAMDTVCRSGDAGKAAIQKLKLITVSHAKTESETFANGTLHYEVPYNGTGGQKLVAFMENQM